MFYSCVPLPLVVNMSFGTTIFWVFMSFLFVCIVFLQYLNFSANFTLLTVSGSLSASFASKGESFTQKLLKNTNSQKFLLERKIMLMLSGGKRLDIFHILGLYYIT